MTPIPEKEVPRLCRWCLLGSYQPMVIPAHGNYRNYGLGGAQPEKWRLVRCDQCGHVEWFRNE